MTTTPQRVAVIGIGIGIGIMGTAIATRLLECGHQVTVFDINPATCKLSPLLRSTPEPKRWPAALGEAC